MDSSRLAELLQPFLSCGQLSPQLPEKLRAYLELLQRWNARTNLTAVRNPEQIVTRHFGESLFAANLLFPAGNAGGGPTLTVADVGSGAGFPGVPIKLFVPQVHLTLIEAQNKKATFLREVVRTLQLENAEVFTGRAEQWNQTADVVTLRAVEKFEQVLPVAARLVAHKGRLCLLIGEAQAGRAASALPDLTWQAPVHLAGSSRRTVMVGIRG